MADRMEWIGRTLEAPGKAIVEARKAMKTMRPMEAMREMDRLFRTHGVESSNFKRIGRVYYLNTGDSYTATVLFYGGTFKIGDWGSLAEKYPDAGWSEEY